MERFLKIKHSGFMGKTHWLMSLAFFMALWHLPQSIPIIGAGLSQFMSQIKTGNYLFILLVFFVLGGASLIPDLDSSKLEGGDSTAGERLGFVGTLISLVMVALARVTWSVLHLPADDKPKSGHRLLWHTWLMGIIIFFWMLSVFPNSSNNIMGTINIHNILTNLSQFMAVVVLGVSVYIGTNMLFYQVFKLIGMGRYTNIVSTVTFVGSIIALYILPFSQIRLLGITFAFGYIFHVTEDLLTQGSSPVAFPVPLMKQGKFQLWFKGFIPFSLLIQTGGIVNSIMDYVFIGIDLLLVWYTFFV